jgi:hypothetical protein
MNRSMPSSAALAACLWGLWAAPAHAQMDQFMNNVVSEPPRASSGVTQSKADSGLKDALQVAAERAVESAGRPDGYFGNPQIRIPMPEKLEHVEKAVRRVGLGAHADEFVLSMNRAAEKAAPQAKPIFVDAIRGIGFEDARAILGGGDTAATDYFRAHASDRLKAAFAPIVRESMEQTGVTRSFETLMAKAATVPFVKAEKVDLDQYVVGKALDGLFHVMGEQEREIRRNPLARSTALLREIFSR